MSLIKSTDEDRRIHRELISLLGAANRLVVACVHRELRSAFPADALEVE